MKLKFHIFFTGYHNYTGSGEVGDCYDKCFNEDKSNFCRNEGICLKVSLFDEKIVLYSWIFFFHPVFQFHEFFFFFNFSGQRWRSLLSMCGFIYWKTMWGKKRICLYCWRSCRICYFPDPFGSTHLDDLRQGKSNTKNAWKNTRCCGGSEWITSKFFYMKHNWISRKKYLIF